MCATSTIESTSSRATQPTERISIGLMSATSSLSFQVPPASDELSTHSTTAKGSGFLRIVGHRVRCIEIADEAGKVGADTISAHQRFVLRWRDIGILPL